MVQFLDDPRTSGYDDQDAAQAIKILMQHTGMQENDAARILKIKPSDVARKLDFSPKIEEPVEHAAFSAFAENFDGDVMLAKPRTAAQPLKADELAPFAVALGQKLGQKDGFSVGTMIHAAQQLPEGKHASWERKDYPSQAQVKAYLANERLNADYLRALHVLADHFYEEVPEDLRADGALHAQWVKSSYIPNDSQLEEYNRTNAEHNARTNALYFKKLVGKLSSSLPKNKLTDEKAELVFNFLQQESVYRDVFKDRAPQLLNKVLAEANAGEDKHKAFDHLLAVAKEISPESFVTNDALISQRTGSALHC